MKKLFGNEPQDQGYASERSPEEEHPPKLPEQALSNGSGKFDLYLFLPDPFKNGTCAALGNSNGPYHDAANVAEVERQNVLYKLMNSWLLTIMQNDSFLLSLFLFRFFPFFFDFLWRNMCDNVQIITMFHLWNVVGSETFVWKRKRTEVIADE